MDLYYNTFDLFSYDCRSALQTQVLCVVCFESNFDFLHRFFFFLFVCLSIKCALIVFFFYEDVFTTVSGAVYTSPSESVHFISFTPDIVHSTAIH